MTRVLIGDAQPNRRLVGPRRAVPYIEEVGTAALVTRFVAATVSHRPNPSPIEREVLKRREGTTSATASPSPRRHAVNALDFDSLRLVHDSAAGVLDIAVGFVFDH